MPFLFTFMNVTVTFQIFFDPFFLNERFECVSRVIFCMVFAYEVQPRIKIGGNSIVILMW